MIEVLIIVLLILALFSSGYSWHRRADYGVVAPGVVGLLTVVLLVILIIRFL